jgi:hypothetical protein
MDLVITCSGVTGAGVINGFQICDGYALTLTQAAGGFPVVISNFRGNPGSLYANLATTHAGAYPQGPMFGLDMTAPEVIGEIMAGAPFLGYLGPNGTAAFSMPGLPPGLTVYCVSIEADPVTFAVLSVTDPFFYTIL